MNYEKGLESVGKLVIVSDGSKRPPERHNRKLQEWEGNNFSGKLESVEETKWYDSGYRAKILVSESTVMVMYKSVDLETVELTV